MYYGQERAARGWEWDPKSADAFCTAARIRQNNANPHFASAVKRFSPLFSEISTASIDRFF